MPRRRIRTLEHFERQAKAKKKKIKKIEKIEKIKKNPAAETPKPYKPPRKWDDEEDEADAVNLVDIGAVLSDPYKRALNKIEEIRSTIDDVDPDSRDTAEEFFTSVSESLDAVEATIVKTQRVTNRQQTAIENWEHGVSKWLR